MSFFLCCNEVCYVLHIQQLLPQLQGLSISDCDAVGRLRLENNHHVRGWIILFLVQGCRSNQFVAFFHIHSVSGENMAARAAEDFSQVKPIMQALLTSVLLLHDAGIVHGDIKPRNIMRTGGVGSFMYRCGTSMSITSRSKPNIPPSPNTDSSTSTQAPVFRPPPVPILPRNFAIALLAPNPAQCVFPGFIPLLLAALQFLFDSRYSPPELFYVENGKARVKDFHVTPNGECVADGPYEPVQASIAHDMWSLGAVMYELLTNETLFHGNSASDNMNSDEFLTLAEWSDDIKAKKLSKVPNLSFIREASCRYSLFEDGTSRGTTFRQPNFARNLLSILLMRDPAARPRSISHVLEHPLFRDGKSPGRLVGEKAKYDFFLSYRVAAKVDAELLSDIWTQLTQRGYRVFWDKQDLHKGREWEKEFCEGLVCSHVFVPLLSQAAVKNPDNPRANFEMLMEESDCDNVLLEHRLALELKDRGFVQSIMPLLIGQCNNGTIDKFQFSQLPAAAQLPKVQVWALEAKLREHLGNHCMGTPYEFF
jgi:serine/threonine protein kinase